MKLLAATVFSAALLTSVAHAAPITVCVKHYKGNESDFGELFKNGPITVPSGTIFNYAGHLFGTDSDPLDEGHMSRAPERGWIGVPAREEKRRLEIAAHDMASAKPEQAFITTESLTLTAQKYCKTVNGRPVTSSTWQWKNRTITDTGQTFYEAFGISGPIAVDTSFNNAGSLGEAAQSGQIVAVLRGELNDAKTIP
ncbi:hypothetical protein JK165_08960 [Acetobacter okinawensis]|uniref:hypothetical protein n=1 Tax=Acetobacter okinawensis TaxID=1076594 RepID=UPI001BA7C779|nr:hypothetical protein [Acetobacter okinawensis]MBS0966215.1 hypothetical protein [Acetobacter okinawensis]